MKRGDLVTVALAGDFGKPRPALIVQADPFDLTATVTVLLLSSDLVDAPLIRLTIQPNAANGLRLASQIMVDKAMTVRRDRIGQIFGRVDPDMMIAVNRSLALFLGLG
ncbi:type II toxin-antitoxin system PemK/MazF family toxin [Bosea sp. NBC_00550]|uniref:type II toxin-antitoxin system PemK/MazF family toxin n=1 Tax=Bosea sp. NBC_00550 TaxID=2969621 RepID=UPI0022317B0C|nr:type II toxin-antitoxin system PemK/MazF family toxin [Bosea sp. NBC_00550]UZF92763.1 type II toxin-antitoxin system PemK/MazF family toxin [Bosea sp. NBC_00550]